MIFKVNKIFIFSIIFLLNTAYTNRCIGQTKKDISDFREIFDSPSTQEKKQLTDRPILNLTYSIYKNFISSQDHQHCIFYPSCSTYMFEAIQKHGFIEGSLLGLDRLTRCHPLSSEKYLRYKNSNFRWDPLQ